MPYALLLHRAGCHACFTHLSRLRRRSCLSLDDGAAVVTLLSGDSSGGCVQNRECFYICVRSVSMATDLFVVVCTHVVHAHILYILYVERERENLVPSPILYGL